MNRQAAARRPSPPQRAMRKYIGTSTVSKARKNSSRSSTAKVARCRTRAGAAARRSLRGGSRGRLEVGVQRAEEGQQRGQDDEGEGDAVDAEVDAHVECGDPADVGRGLHLRRVVVVEAEREDDRGDEHAPVTVTPCRSTACAGDLPFSPGGAGRRAASAPRSGPATTNARRNCITDSLISITPAHTPVATRTAATARTTVPASSALT